MPKKWKTRFSLLIVIGISVWIGSLISPMVWNYGKDSLLDAQKISDSPSIQQAVSLERAFQEVFNFVSPSVVSIATERTIDINNQPFMHDPFFEHFFGDRVNPGQSHKQTQRGLGSGIILNQEGYILTNEHVVRNMDKLTIKLSNNKTFEAKLIGSDSDLDLALLKIEGSKELKPVSMGNSSEVKVGNWAIAIGSPLGFEQSFTVGVVSSISRGGIDSSGLNYIQTDAAINQGNSGGPLLNIKGEVVGVNRMIASQNGGSIGIGFAIPINEAKDIVEELKNNGKIVRPWLGVGLDRISAEERESLKIPQEKGAIVRQVVQNSPAQKSGILPKDVIVRIGDKDVENPIDVVNKVRHSKVGSRISVELIRNNSTIHVVVIPEKKPD
ncbi:MAG: trypsin-like peptidase domain-containing protein [Leptospiraceae bacterium]|nr:trypsin-like peptidase domain-containing protein [Leptospiraceae bacterium]MCP5496529.1 trypsin-like peptidase domain-containing protein [Leptospiraceae bacterium]